jgi:hypothetical protein
MGSLSFLLAAFRFLRLGRIGEPVVRSFQKEYAMSEKFFSEQPSYSNFGSNIIPIELSNSYINIMGPIQWDTGSYLDKYILVLPFLLNKIGASSVKLLEITPIFS